MKFQAILQGFFALVTFQCVSAQSIVDIAIGDDNDNFSTLVAALQAAGLDDPLSKEGTFSESYMQIF